MSSDTIKHNIINVNDVSNVIIYLYVMGIFLDVYLRLGGHIFVSLKYFMFFLGVLICFIDAFLLFKFLSKKILFLAMFSLCVSFSYLLINGNLYFGNITLSLISCFIALKVIKSSLNYKVFYLIFIMLSTLFVVDFLFVQEGIFATHRNGVSFYMILCCVLCCFIRYKSDKKVDLLPAVITLFLSVLAQGRSGIVSSAILFFGCLFFFINKKRNVLIFLCLSSPIILIAFILTSATFLDFLSPYLGYFWTAKLNIGSRSEIWSSYFSELGLYGILFGPNSDVLAKNSFLANWDFNLHNSFLSFHYHFGVILFALFVLSAYALVKSFLNCRFVFLLLVVIIIRVFTDTGLFVGFFDFIFYTLLFYALFYKYHKCSGVK